MLGVKKRCYVRTCMIYLVIMISVSLVHTKLGNALVKAIRSILSPLGQMNTLQHSLTKIKISQLLQMRGFQRMGYLLYVGISGAVSYSELQWVLQQHTQQRADGYLLVTRH